MSTAGPEGLEPLRALTEARPDLADRVARLVDGLWHIEPLTWEMSWDRAAEAVDALQRLGVVDYVGDDHLPGRALSDVAHRALRLAIVRDLGWVALLVGNAAADLAIALGRAFEPHPNGLLRIYRDAAGALPDFAEQVAWLAAARGPDPLVAALADDLATNPSFVLEFLEAAVEADTTGPYRGAPPPAERDSYEDDDGWRGYRELSEVEEEESDEFPTTDTSRAPGWVERQLDEVLRRRDPGNWPKATPSSGSDVGATPQDRPPGSTPAVVSTGFAAEPGDEGLPAERTLAKGRRYQFFVEIGPGLAADAIDTSDTPLPELPAGTVLQVALFGFPGELEPEPGADVGELRLIGDGTAIVHTQPGGVLPGRRRLYLAVATPDHPGVLRMRCNIYCRQSLLQSRLVEVQVTDEELIVGGPTLRAVLDFAVVSDLAPEQVETLSPRTLSLLINDDGHGTHGFRFFAGTEFKHDATLTGETLAEALEQARGGLRRASWGTPAEPSRAEFAGLTYRYQQPTLENLTHDLTMLARSGFIVWDALVDQLAGDEVAALTQLMREPGVIELANKESLDLLVPAACIYDYPVNPEDDDLTICTDYLAARGTTALAGTPCFQGDCPSYDDPTVVCPSGFWGFRHQIGYSASLTGGTPDDARNQALAIPAQGAPVFTTGASADQSLTQRDEHLRCLQQLAGDNWNFAWSRTDLFTLFNTTTPSVVYLYGHGGREGRAAYFEVGSGTDGPIIRSSLRGKADWRTTRPLVFLNGCHSAALAPDAAFSYATGFLQTAHASAVVGTEIAVFETLAVAFAEHCLHRFVTERRPLGEAVRDARLTLLDHDIPLGLVYLAFGPSELHLA